VYTNSNLSFGSFGKVLFPSDVLLKNNEYIFTFEPKLFLGLFAFGINESQIRINLNERLANYGTVISVSRPFFSSNLLVRIIPSVNVSLQDWLNAIGVSLEDMGMEETSFIMAEGGTVSSQPGGVQELMPSIGTSIGSTIGAALSSAIQPLFPYLLIAGAVYYFLILKKGRR